MGRPPMALGTYGTIRFARTPGGYRAKVRMRGFDGVVRDVSRTGASKAKAVRDLKKALTRELNMSTNGDLSSNSRFKEVAERWMAYQRRRLAVGKRAPGTIDNYQSVLNNHVLPALGELRLFEVTVPRLNAFLTTVQSRSSAAHARTGRAVVSGVLRYAVSEGALTTSPMRDTNPIEGSAKTKARALDAGERRAWLERLENDPRAVAKDLPDLTRFMLATGVRMGEALALQWEDVELESADGVGLVRIEWTVVRVRGNGLVRTDPKTSTSERTLPLPSWTVAMLDARWNLAVSDGATTASPVFPDSLGGPRDPSNTARALREARGSDGFAWVTSHVFRKTAATILDEAGLSARTIADQLGHAKPSMTQDRYLGRHSVSPATAEAMEGLL